MRKEKNVGSIFFIFAVNHLFASFRPDKLLRILLVNFLKHGYSSDFFEGCFEISKPYIFHFQKNAG